MREPTLRRFGSIAVGCLLFGSAIAGGHRLPDRFAPDSLDGQPVVVEDSVRGVTWSAWAYRNGAEYDIAVSWLDASGRWSEPELLGFDDDVDQLDPALIVDRNGVVYLAFVEAKGRAVRLAVRRGTTGAWIGPHVAARTTGGARSPALLEVGDRIVLAYRDGEHVALMDFDAVPGPDRRIDPFGIQEGPDVIDPLGREIKADNDEIGEPSEDRQWKDARRPDSSGTRRLKPRNEASHDSRER